MEEIKVPVLVCHGDKDGEIPFSQAQQASDLIPGAELYKQEGGWHMMVMHAKGFEVQEHQIEFAKKHLAQP